MKNHITTFILFLLFTVPSFACTVCFGGADADLRRGFTWGILLLGALPYLLLSLFVGYIIIQTRKNKNKNKETA